MNHSHKNTMATNFLKERYATLKATRKVFSARYLSKKAGFSSPSYFNMIVNGERSLTFDSALKIAAALELSQEEKNWLLLTVKLSRTEDSTEQDRLVKKLKSFEKPEKNKMEPRHIEILSDPTTVKLYLLPQSANFKFTWKWMSRHLAETDEADIKNRIEKLLQSGLWIRNGKSIAICSPNIASGEGVDEFFLKKFHASLLKIAGEALNQPRKNRVFGARSFWIKEKDIPKLEKKLASVRAHVDSQFEDLNGDCLVTFQTNVFKL